MRLIVAPMEGVVDYSMRRLIARVGGADQMVSEFVRVNDTLLPPKVFHKLIPELKQDYCGYGDTPLVVQLLGSDPESLAKNALIALELGAPAIDMNFGCPAKTVNKSRGGSILLKEPDVVHAAVRAVREAVPSDIEVSAKMRLGYEDKSLAIDNAQAIEAAGASYLTVHARTKVEGYKPPAHWEWISKIRNAVSIPVIANGEVWSVEDYDRCREVSGCDDVMIGRGWVANPLLPLQIKDRSYPTDLDECWQLLKPYILQFYEDVFSLIEERHVHGRIKQWCNMLGWHYPQAKALFQELRTERDALKIGDVLKRHLN
jgi:tRNA-dihydrouridine synthase C